jgi:hypothetical protein
MTVLRQGNSHESRVTITAEYPHRGQLRFRFCWRLLSWIWRLILELVEIDDVSEDGESKEDESEDDENEGEESENDGFGATMPSSHATTLEVGVLARKFSDGLADVGL